VPSNSSFQTVLPLLGPGIFAAINLLQFLKKLKVSLALPAMSMQNDELTPIEGTAPQADGSDPSVQTEQLVSLISGAIQTKVAVSAEPLEPIEMDRHECRSCGYTYEPAKGDPKRKVPIGVEFKDLAPNWRCPICGAPRPQFQNIGAAGAPSGFKENLGYGLGVNTMTPGQKNVLIFTSLLAAVIFFLSLYGLH
jgi:rubredoxin